MWIDSHLLDNRNYRFMMVVAAICPNRNCAATVLVPRADASLNIANRRKRFRLTCPFCGAEFRASPCDLVVRKVAPVWLLIRYDCGDSVAGLYLDGGRRNSLQERG